jgi:hypothetical protein
VPTSQWSVATLGSRNSREGIVGGESLLLSNNVSMS